MNEYPLYVAFHFDRDPKHPIYERGAARLKKRCDELEIPCDICKLDLNKYMTAFMNRNPRLTTLRRIIYRYIPTFILEMLKRHDRSLLYIHCDSMILRRPPVEVFEPGMSVGYSVGHTDKALNNIFASPIFVRPERAAFEFLEHWEHMCQTFNTDESEHVFLGHAIRNMAGYPELKPFSRQVSSEHKKDNPDILYGQGLTKAGEIA